MFALAMVTVSATFQGVVTYGSVINHVDLSPRFAGILFAYTNFFGSIAGIIGPYIADVLTVSLPLHCVCVCGCVRARVRVQCGGGGGGARVGGGCVCACPVLVVLLGAKYCKEAGRKGARSLSLLI